MNSNFASHWHNTSRVPRLFRVFVCAHYYCVLHETRKFTGEEIHLCRINISSPLAASIRRIAPRHGLTCSHFHRGFFCDYNFVDLYTAMQKRPYLSIARAHACMVTFWSTGRSFHFERFKFRGKSLIRIWKGPPVFRTILVKIPSGCKNPCVHDSSDYFSIFRLKSSCIKKILIL